MILKKQVSKDFDYPEMNMKLTVSAEIHKISYRDIQEKKGKAITFLKAVNRKDREALLSAFNSGNIGAVLGNIEDIGAVKDLLNTLEENIRLCLGGSLKITTNDGQEFKGPDAEKELLKEHIDWLAEECLTVNPELFNPSGVEAKKKE